MSGYHLTKALFLPELNFVKQIPCPDARFKIYLLEKKSEREYCPKCATQATTIYDHVYVSIRDVPLRNKNVILKIRKRRFKCSGCGAIYREPVNGIRKGFRTTLRFRRHLMKQSSNYSNLFRVAKENRVSDWLVYKTYYEQLELELRKFKSPWPKTLGIDEHSFIRNRYGRKDFTTIFVDITNRKVKEAAYGRYQPDLLSSENILNIPGRERVKNVVIDLSSGFRSFVRDFFPNAMITADKFHVLKLLNSALMKRKAEVVGKIRKNPFKNMLLRKGRKLKLHEREVLRAILHFYPELKDIYTAKEALFSFYEIRGYKKARFALQRLTDWLAYSKVPELKTLRRTLMNWREEILNYFKTRITNGMTEGYNRKAKLIQRNAYGFRNFENYRLKLLYHCSR